MERRKITTQEAKLLEILALAIPFIANQAEEFKTYVGHSDIKGKYTNQLLDSVTSDKELSSLCEKMATINSERNECVLLQKYEEAAQKRNELANLYYDFFIKIDYPIKETVHTVIA